MTKEEIVERLKVLVKELRDTYEEEEGGWTWLRIEELEEFIEEIDKEKVISLGLVEGDMVVKRS